jgi:TonB family protein
MKRFYFLSILFHAVLLILLFCWETPLANKPFTGHIIEVTLIENVERKDKKEGAKVVKGQKEERNLERKEPLQPSEEKEEKKEEKKEPAPAASKKEKLEKDEPALPEDKTLVAKAEFSLEAREVSVFQTRERGTAEAFMPAANSNHESKTKSSSGSTFFAPSTFGGEGEETSLRAGSNPGAVKGEESFGPVAKVRPSSKEIDPTLLLIMRKIEAAKRYPKLARKMGIEGIAVVRFKLKPAGQVETVEILESSGSEILDKASLETVLDAAPLPYKEGWLKVGIVFKIL